MSEQSNSQRIDKWLWHGRFVKTRSLAQKLVKSGKVRLDREKISNTSHPVKPGNVLTIALANRVRIIRITGIGARRGSFEEARQLYEDITPVEQQPEQRKKTDENMATIHSTGRPDKHQQRKLIELKQNSGR